MKLEMRGWASISSILAGTGLTFLSASALAAGLVAAVLPSSRSVQVGNTATAFATIINGSGQTGNGCKIAPTTSVPAAFSSSPTSATIVSGGAQNYTISFTPSAAFSSTEVQFAFTCNGGLSATPITGVNSFLFSASNTPVSDIVAIAATVTGRRHHAACQ